MIVRLAPDPALSHRLLGCAWLSLLGCLAVGPALAATGEARVGVAIASVYSAPSQSAERVTQAFLWDRILVVKERGPWVRVLVPSQYRSPEGYPGWMLRKHLVEAPPEVPVRLATVRVPRAEVRAQPSPGGKVVSAAYMGSDLPVRAQQGEWLEVALPGNPSRGWIPADEVVEGALPSRSDALLGTAGRFRGTPYLWGGMCRAGIDCSGLVWTVFKLHGYVLPRDADQQFQVGAPVDREHLEPGDLVFFGSQTGRITHVGIYAGEGEFLDASGSQGVATSRLSDDRVVDGFVGGRRILGPPR